MWATICTVTHEGNPYAIEATPFFDGETICFMINPRGSTARNIQKNTDVLLKFTQTNSDLSKWFGVSCFGQGFFVREVENIRRGWGLLGRVMKADYSLAAEKYSANPKLSPLFCVKIAKMTGRSSSKAREILEI
jgi:nitroimidazol reductase NimA-like FMN-containing flavoprotein (pyridoxamine 5'-phosphate oxidase superfamily)